MFSTGDTIVAIATPPGRGGIGVVRISGPGALAIARGLTTGERPFEARYATLTRVVGPAGAIDRVVVTAFPAPHSYTGEDVAEISAHGSPVLLETIVAGAMAAGARLAEPGEFTLRAYLNGRIDLVQAEAVRDLVDAVTPVQARAAFDQLEGTLTRSIQEIDEALFDLSARLEASLDFPEEGYHFVTEGGASREIAALSLRIGALLTEGERGRLIREGVQVVLTGRPNSGKSSLFNRLAGAGRAIVTDVPGTTRDLITERAAIGGLAVTLVDTAGVREAPADAIEAEGIARAAAARSVASVVLIVLDGAAPLGPADRRLLDDSRGVPHVVAANKSDLPRCWEDEEAGEGLVRVSAATGEGMDALRAALVGGLRTDGAPRDVPAVTNLRHLSLLGRARAALDRAGAAAGTGVPEEFVLADLNEARALLEEVTGRRTADETIAHIFSTFCIGK
jgi:tRNA modification GTPase